MFVPPHAYKRRMVMEGQADLALPAGNSEHCYALFHIILQLLSYQPSGKRASSRSKDPENLTVILRPSNSEGFRL